MYYNNGYRCDVLLVFQMNSQHNKTNPRVFGSYYRQMHRVLGGRQLDDFVYGGISSEGHEFYRKP